MVRLTGFEEAGDQFENLAEEFERIAEETEGAGATSQAGVRGRDPLTGKFESLKDAIQRGISRAVRTEVLTPSNREYNAEYLPSDQSARLSASGQWYRDEFELSIFSRNDLVAYHEFGTGTHSEDGAGFYIIPQESDGPVAFEWDALGGQTVVFDHVVHPGVEGKHIVEGNLLHSTQEMKRQVERRIDNIDLDTV